ncbi:DUF2254 family protein [uncultured Methanolobus sp.]|uniref:DUF2254 family protein n=1 Tax=uncultured Methanolobus sp. TaxID=218300 RepID=UPI0029C82A6E|nr:DUF2254 family protein [uncultured Methanolobus sp.]
MLPNKLKEKCNELADYFDQPAWKNRILFYSAIFLSIALAFIIIFGIFNLIIPNFTFPNNAINYDNERYLLSALVQSLAATIALVITLSLVAVQLAAQSYSPRVIDVYKRNPDMWILLCIYIITIFYGLGLIKVVELDISEINMEGAIFVAYFMGFFAFVCLVPYMLKTLDLLKPSTVIKLLAADITKEKILRISDDDENIEDKDSIQPLIDIINKATENNDYETTRNGLKAIRKKYINIILRDRKITQNEERKISGIVSKHICKVGNLAINKGKEDTLLETISFFEHCGKVTAIKDHNISALNSAYSIVSLGFRATKKELDYPTQEAIDSIKIIEDIFIENKADKEAFSVCIRYAKLIEEAANNNLQCTEYAIFLLEEVVLNALEKEIKQNQIMADMSINTLERIIEYAMETKQKNLEVRARRSYFYLKENVWG